MRLLLLALLTALGALRAGEAAPARPCDLRLARWNALLVEAYRAHGEHGPWDAAAERFLAALALRCRDGNARIAADAVRDLAAQALQAGCTDPLVRVRAGLLWMDGYYGSHLIAQALPALQARLGTPAAYSPLHLLAGLQEQTRLRDKGVRETARLLLGPTAVAAMRAADPARLDAVGLDELAEALEDLVDPRAVGEAASLAVLAAAREGGSPWLALVMDGTHEIALAWASRGNGWAREVTAEGWKGFNDHLAAARRLLTQAQRERPDIPRAACLMITVSMGDDADDPRDWFNQALRADAQCRDAYHRLSYALMPRWRGSHAEMARLARRATAGGGLDGPMPGLVERIVSLRLEDATDRAAGWREPAIWALLDPICPADASLPADQALVLRLRRVAYLWTSGQRAAALELYQRCGGAQAPFALPGAMPGIIDGSTEMLLCALDRGLRGDAIPDHCPLPPLDGPRPAPAAATDRFPLWYHGGAAAPGLLELLGPGLARARQGGAPAAAASAAALAAGNDDPLVAYAALSLAPPGDRRRALAAAWAGLAAAGYPPAAQLQPARTLMVALAEDGDPGAAEELGRRREDFRALLAAVARDAADGLPPAVRLRELLAVADSEILADDLAAAAGDPAADPLVAQGLGAWLAVRAAARMPQRSSDRELRAWTAYTQLWSAWRASGVPRLAAAMAVACGIECRASREARWWFDRALEGAADDPLVWDGLLTAYAQAGRAADLLALGEEILRQPADDLRRAIALEAVRRVMDNRWLRNPKRWQRAWGVADPCTAEALDPAATLAPQRRRGLLHLRAGYAAMAGQDAAARRALAALGAPPDPALLPPGTDTARLDPAGREGDGSATAAGAAGF